MDLEGSLNLFAYCNNNPVNLVDISGELAAEAAIAATNIWNPIGWALAVVVVVEVILIAVAITRLNDSGTFTSTRTGAEAHEGQIEDYLYSYSPHTKGSRPSTENKHQEGDARRNRDNHGEKGDSRRNDRSNKRNHNGTGTSSSSKKGKGPIKAVTK